MANKARFTPIRGTESQVLAQSKSNGNIYFTKDTGKIYLDISDTERILVGNSGIALFYSNEVSVREDSSTETGYILTLSEIENYSNCHEDDLVLNQADGSFYKITEIDTINDDAYVTRLSVSGGSGGGSSSLARNMSLKAVQEEVHGSIINGQTANAIVTVKSDTDDYGEAVNNQIAIQWSIYVSGSTVPYLTGSFVATHGEAFTFEYGTRLRENTTSTVQFSATDSNGKIYTKGFTVSTIELTLTESTTFSKTSLYNSTTDFKLACNVKGLIQKQLIFSIDGEVVDTQVLATTTTGTIQSKALSLTHGSHTAKIELYSYDNNVVGAGPDPLEFEFAYVETGKTEPIIWLGSYNDIYYSYDKIQIPYLAYDPNNPTSATINFYKGSALLEAKSTSIDWSSGSVSFHLFEITDATIDAQNLYTIMCGVTAKNIVFECQTDPNRDMNVKSDGLLVKFDASGRSNNESSVNREIWKYDYVSATNSANNKTYTGTFDGFNWYNNGWVLDDDNNTCLRISNGAKFSVDLGNMDINTSTEGKKACTFEFEFKVKNIQNYSKVIKEITRYAFVPDSTKNDTRQAATDEAAYNAFVAAGAENYDYWLTQLYTGDNEEYKAAGYTNVQAYIGSDISYDDLTISSVTKIKNPDVAFAKYFNNNGFCLGSQDGFFYDGAETVNVKYVEDQLVDLAIVFDQSSKLVIFYLDGVMSSVSSITPTGSITLDGGSLVFNSNVCDIDLYKFRVYNKALDVKAIDTNYAVDHRDVLYYDQSDVLAEPNSALNGEYQLTYANMLQYNEDHPNDYLMPYIIFDTTNATTDNGGLGAGVLPYRKSKKTNGVHVTFVNTGLEHAYETGELGTLAAAAGYTDIDGGKSAIEQYYEHHCPSWTSLWPTTDDGATSEVAAASNQSPKAVNMAVQGTSSEFYPRRNYKIKLKGKDKDGNSLIYMYMNKGPFAEKYLANPEDAHLKWFYYNNDNFGTNKFTMKVDYMESSGTYNMGFANFVSNAYTKHPLYDYNKAGAFEVEDNNKTTYTEATEYVAGTKYYYKNHKGNWKNTEEDELQISSAEDFAKGPVQYASDNKITKVLTATSASSSDVQAAAAAEGISADAFVEKYLNKWFTGIIGYSDATIPNIGDLRTNVQGFPVLAFHKNGDKYTFIGRYNMLLDKGSDEAYGFKPDSAYKAKFLNHQSVADMAECWEFSDNSRTWCSYNDPLGRKTLSFGYPADGSTTVEDPKAGDQKINEPETGGSGGAPYVANSFEYRYSKHADVLDYMYAPETGGIDIDDVQPSYPGYDLTSQTDRNALTFDIYKNWEKACQWLYSTRIDSQPSQNAFTAAGTVTEETFAAGTYYIKTDEVQYEEATGVFDSTANYYERIEIVDENDTTLISYSYEYVEGLTEDEYNAGTYYLANTTGYKKATSYSSSETYYIADFSYKQDQYKLFPAVTIGNITYEYDTKEYRLAKFKNEFADHFDLEYCLVYFVMTEVFMCYDSRGKNCMMASWGPLKEGGEYIWYPIFYDMDTQLGINNTGIPSFEYYVNATEEGCFSTNDSVLWTNLYKAYFAEIKAKYYQMRGSGNGIVNLITGKTTTPLVGAASASAEDNVDDLTGTVQHIEKWYTADPDECNSIAMRGARPHIALNLDEYYKYISIMNPKIQYQNRDGGYETDGGTYFYALQGDRSLSRQQFLSNRINFIDSWLNYGEYARGGSAIFGRIGANNAKDTNNNKVYSDYWLNTDDDSKVGQTVPEYTELTYNHYYDENGNKTEYLDADVSVSLVPYQHSYVAIGGDNGISASEQYNGTAVKLDLPSSVVEGRLTSPNYGEQLFYIYGTKSLQDIGDMSTLYWTEFYATKSPRLQRLLLGSNYPGFFNKNMNYPNFDASSSSAYGKPLLEEVNMDNITLTSTAGKYTFDFSSSEKLKHFEALGSNITGVTFAAGVALDTLYLPETLTTLRLVEARRLKNVITTKPMPSTVEEFNNWNTDDHQGFYVEGLTNLINSTIASTDYSNISTLYIAGGNLDYGTYSILDTLYKLKNTAAANTNSADTLAISLTDVNWTPYTQLVEGDVYNDAYNYYLDNRHYHLDSYTFDNSTWEQYILDGRLYKIAKDAVIPTAIQDIDLLLNIADNSRFTNTNSTGSTEIPIITGVMFINNTTAVEESVIRNNLLEKYPNLQVFFNNITEARSANFITVDDETGAETIIATQKVDAAAADTWFTKNPYSEYAGKTSKNHWVFKGWSTVKGDATYIIPTDTWMSQTFTDGKLDYNFYAIFEHETYTVQFFDGDGNIFDTQYIVYGNFASEPATTPTKTYTAEEEAANVFGGYNFKCYSLSANSSNAITLSSYPITDATDFYAVFTKVDDLRKYVHNELFTFTPFTYTEITTMGGDSSYNLEGYKVSPASGKILTGKVVIPSTYNDKPVVAIGGFYNQQITHLFFAENSKVRQIDDYAFCENDDRSRQVCSTLKYIEFIDSIRYIGASAFRDVPLEVYRLPDKCYYIGVRAFLNAFKSNTAITIIIGSEITAMSYYAIANNDNIPSSGNTIIIGSNSSKAKLNLTYNSDTSQKFRHRRIYNSAFTSIQFYSANYNNRDDIAYTNGFGDYTVADCLDEATGGISLQVL